MSKKVVFTFGRMNPPTIGHEKLANKIKAIAKQEEADARIYLSHTQNPIKDPLSYQQKLAFAKKAFGIVKKTNAKQIFQIVKELYEEGYTDIIMVVGSDRVTEFKTILKKYNGKGDYDFDSIKVVSAGKRDPDAEGVEGMSGTKLRGLAKKGQFDDYTDEDGKKQFGFGSAAASKLSDRDKKKMMDMVGKALKEDLEFAEWTDEDTLLYEEIETLDLTEAPLSTAQRKKRAQLMKRLAPKIARIRKQKAKRQAGAEQLKKRAQKQAIQIVRKKVAGEKGIRYKDLSPGEKQSVDRMVAKKSGMVQKIAKKLMPKVKKGEQERVKAARSKTESFELDSLIEEALIEVKQDTDIKDREGTQPSIYFSGLAKSTKAKRDAAFKKQAKMDDDNPDAYKPAPGDADAKTKPSVHTKKYKQMFGEEQLDEKIKGLVTKAEKSGISYGILKKVYDRGMAAWKTGHRPGTTPQQWAFARVNSFLTGGKTRTTADADLWAKAKGRKESLEEAKSSTGYELYHKDFSSAMAHAYDFAKKKFGIEVDPKEIDDKVASGPRKPSKGKTNSYRLKGKDGKKTIQVQVYGMDNGKYELNMYKESVELEEKLKVSDGIGAWIKDFLQSDAPQFAGKSDAKKKQMAIAAYIEAGGEMGPDEGANPAQQAAIAIAKKKSGKYDEDGKRKDEGLWDNIRKKKERIKQGSGEKMRSKGDKGAPTSDQMARASESYELGTDDYTDHTKDMTPGQTDEMTVKDKKLPNLRIATGKSAKQAKQTLARSQARADRKKGTPLAAAYNVDDDFGGKPVKKFKDVRKKKNQIDEGIQYHLDTGVPFSDNIFRHDSPSFYRFFQEARVRYRNDEFENLDAVDKQILQSDIGLFGIYENAEVPLDCPLMEADKDVELNKPKRGGNKKFYVYVKSDKGNVIKVEFGDTTGLKAKINDRDAARSFAARHQCDTKNDKTKPGYWACRLPWFAKSLGLEGGGKYFW